MARGDHRGLLWLAVGFFRGEGGIVPRETIVYYESICKFVKLTFRDLVHRWGINLARIRFNEFRKDGPLSFPLNEPRKWRKAMAMLSFDYSRQFSITMYLGISCRLRGHSPVIKKGIAAPDLLLARSRQFLRRILCPVNSIPVYREFPSKFNAHPRPLTLFITITTDDTSIRYRCN